MKNEKPKTYYNRSQTARILGSSSKTLIRWERTAGSLFVPCRPKSAFSSEPQYHRLQIEYMDRALADPDDLKRYEESWAVLRTSLGTITMREAEDLGLVRGTVKEGT